MDDGDGGLPPALARLLALNARRPPAIVRGEPPYCSFCGRGRGEYGRLLGGSAASICNLCLADARSVLERDGT